MFGRGGGDIPAGKITMFSIFSSTLSKVGPVFSLFSLNIGLRVFGRTEFNMSVTYLIIGGACEFS